MPEEIKKVEKYTDLYLVGIDLDGHDTRHSVNICDTCFAVISTEWDHWEKHVAWHLDGLEDDQ